MSFSVANNAAGTVSDKLLERLSDRQLARATSLVAGREIHHSASGKTYEVTNPANGERVSVMPDCGVAETRDAIAAAEAAQPSWAARTGKERAMILRAISDQMIAHVDDLATILTMEMGKPLAEARGEILYGASYFEWFAEEAKRIYGDTIPGHERDKRIFVLKQPIGVVGAITPWNFPNAMIARKIAPALAAGCAIVCKPAALTPLSAMAIGVLAERAGLPDGLLSLISGTNAPAIGLELCTNARVRKISFTGSTEVGRTLMRQCADQVKRTSLELGGNAPFIVFDDADLDAAVEGAIAAKFRNAGQTCVCANRLYVQRSIYDAFAQKLGVAIGQLKMGDGFAEDTTIGPLIEEKSVAKIEQHINDAVDRGAQVAVGGARRAPGSLFFAPTMLTGMTSAMTIAREETFGPVAPLFVFSTEDEVVDMANDTEFGLSAYFYGRDLSRVWRVAERLHYGIVGINTGKISTEVAPFGGVKQSGMGHEGSKYGFDDYLELKYLCVAI